VAAPFPYAGEAIALFGSVLWAVAGILFMRIRPLPSSGAVNVGKTTTAVVCFAVVFLVTTGRPWPTRTPLEPAAWFAVSGFLGLAICDLFFMRALFAIGPQRASLFMAINPVLIALGAMLPPFRETPSALAWVGMLVCTGGVALAVRRREPDPVAARALRAGMADAFVAAALQATGFLLSRWATRTGGTDAGEGTMIRCASGLLGLLAIGLVLGRTGRWLSQLRTPRAWWQVGRASFVGTFLGIWASLAAIAWSRHTGVAGTLNALSPVFLIPLSAAFLGERHDRRAWTATLVTIAGIALIGLAEG
jgi:drug/metabolite transporter (DMT)-like permease